jgi:hypothetical protein
MPDLTDRDRAILEFEESWPKLDASKEIRIRSTFSLSAARYFQLLNALIERPEALQFKPTVVKRLLRQRGHRVAQRAARRV